MLRGLSTAGEDSSSNHAFDRNMKILQRDGAARAHKSWRDGDGKDVVYYDYFREEVALRLVDRLDDIRREEGFPLALEIGKVRAQFAEDLCPSLNMLGRRFWTWHNPSQDMLG